MIEIVSQPNAPCFTGNPAIFQLRGTNYIVTGSNYISFGIKKTGEVSAGDYFIFPDLKGGGTFQFTAVDEPDDSGLQFTAGQSLEETVNEMQACPLLANYFHVAAASWSGMIFFASRENRAIDISGLNLDNIPGYTFFSSFETGADLVTQENYQVNIGLLQGDPAFSGTPGDFYMCLARFTADVDSSGELALNAEKLFKYLFDEPDVPYFNQDTITKSKLIQKARFEFSEEYGEIAEQKQITYSEWVHVLNGRLDPEYAFANNLSSDISLKKKYLVSAPQKTRYSYYGAHQYLYFLFCIDSPAVFLLKCKVYYTDGSTAEQYVSEINLDETYMELICIPAGASQLGLDGIEPGKTIYKYELGLWDNTGTQFGEARYFFLKERPVVARQFLALNKYGVFETFIATGTQEEAYKMSRKSAKHLASSAIDPAKGHYSSIIEGAHPEFKCNTGEKPMAEILFIKELLSSEHIYLVDEQNQVYKKIIPLDDSYKVCDEADDLHSIDFKYRLAYD